jgi:hypothetical protein
MNNIAHILTSIFPKTARIARLIRQLQVGCRDSGRPGCRHHPPADAGITALRMPPPHLLRMPLKRLPSSPTEIQAFGRPAPSLRQGSRSAPRPPACPGPGFLQKPDIHMLPARPRTPVVRILELRLPGKCPPARPRMPPGRMPGIRPPQALDALRKPDIHMLPARPRTPAARIHASRLPGNCPPARPRTPPGRMPGIRPPQALDVLRMPDIHILPAWPRTPAVRIHASRLPGNCPPPRPWTVHG